MTVMSGLAQSRLDAASYLEAFDECLDQGRDCGYAHQYAIAYLPGAMQAK
jgi:hypothetical protein